ncbi:inner membrane protein oxa1-1, mitochondrial [Culex quinquefasciatus]|uniref:Inner membrane protein oxa1-1, mitochondrial n=1 Tax=Culex quinquefasciatus TaxID=7176 RepID=B0WXK3_CULQU|nr:inner membrane protein oxa1-1, mitochondrial [Culex quinquefasciatus]|eukprot:XP_001862125.1 inner membrane protein oxa1-1, mitochondrial [Culex quinquefasciatus]
MLSRAGRILARSSLSGKISTIQELAVTGSGANRCYHIAACGSRFEGLNTNKVMKWQNRFVHPAMAAVLVRNISTNDADKSLLEHIPEPPPIPVAPEVADLVAGAEPTFASLGLGGWSPVGMVQNCMEFLHITADLPWWGCIAIGTVCVRMLLFPLVIASQRNAAKMNNNMPQMQVLQMKMTEARQAGNAIDSARYAQEMVQFMKEKDLNPLKNMLVPLAQAPIFISFFMGLRQMANVPVDSLREGGLFWFPDLTICDQFYALPIITSITMFLTIELGTDSARMSAANMQTVRYVLRAMPLFILPFTINFPGAICLYWVFSNFFSLVQVGFLRIPAVRDYFKIDRLITHKPETLPIKKKKFAEGVKESWTNMKITRELEERTRIDEISFQKAGKGPLVKTYKYDPTAPRPAGNAINAKKR